MTGATHGVPEPARWEIPRSDQVAHPSRWALHSWRRNSQRVIRLRYDVRLHGTEQVPAEGPVVMASNHVGIIDGPLLAIFSPRPVHALTKDEMFTGFLGRFLSFAGQIRLERGGADPTAVRTGLRVLREGGALGIYPEGARGDGEFGRFRRGAAYFALVTGAPVVPVMMFGTRKPGGSLSSLPDRGSRIDIVYGEPFRVAAEPWPRRREHLDQVTALAHEHMLDQLQRAKQLTGRTLPGPVPEEPSRPSPATDPSKEQE